MVAAVLAAVSRAALRRRLAVVLIGVLVAGWVVEALRLYFFPPMAGPTHTVCYLLALGAGVNAVLLAFLGVWLWRGARWATWIATLTLVTNALLVIQPAGAGLERLLLLLTVPAAVLVGSLLAYPEALPAQ